MRIGTWLGLALLFRFSLGPAVALFLVVWFILDRPSRRSIVLCASATALAGAPTLGYNLLRTGNPLISGSLAERAPWANALTPDVSVVPGNVVALLGSPEMGLVWLFPLAVILPALIAHRPMSPVAVAAVAGVTGYSLSIFSIPNATALGYGPRHLIPILPALFLGAIWVTTRIRRGRRIRNLLLGAGLTVNLPALLIRWTSVRGQDAYQDADLYGSIFVINQWRAVWLGITTGVSQSGLEEPISVVVPYTWSSQAMATLGLGRGWWWAVYLVLGLALATVLWHLSDAGEGPSSVGPGSNAGRAT